MEEDIQNYSPTVTRAYLNNLICTYPTMGYRKLRVATPWHLVLVYNSPAYFCSQSTLKKNNLSKKVIRKMLNDFCVKVC